MALTVTGSHLGTKRHMGHIYIYIYIERERERERDCRIKLMLRT